MSISITNINPADNDINVPIDSKIIIAFDSQVDPFTISQGISLYTPSKGIWSGPDLAILDTKYSDVLDIGEDYTYIKYNYTINGNTIEITPLTSLLPNKIFFISVYAGNDSSRYISSPTTSEPEYTRLDQSTGIVNITSAYTGPTNNEYFITVVDDNVISVIYNSQNLGQFNYIENEEINLGYLNISISGTLDVGDEINITVFKASGLTSIYKTSFSTSDVPILSTPSSGINEFNEYGEYGLFPLHIISTIPENLSVNNIKCNPIVLKFSKPLNTEQDILSKIKIYKDSCKIISPRKRINFYYKINGDTVKLYLLNVTY